MDGALIQRWQVAAALSAAVTTTPKQENAPTCRGNLYAGKPTQTPAAFREGARGRGLSQKGRLPRICLILYLVAFLFLDGVEPESLNGAERDFLEGLGVEMKLRGVLGNEDGCVGNAVGLVI